MATFALVKTFLDHEHMLKTQRAKVRFTPREREDMGKMEEYKPVMAMTMIQLLYAGVTVFARATLVHGLSPRVFILYRQAFATIFILPIYLLVQEKIKDSYIFFGSKELFFNILSLAYRHYNQSTLYLEGLYLTSSSMGSAVDNIIPAITFLISFLAGYEKVNLRDIRGLAKIAGTILCVAGAISMTLLRGPKVLNSEFALLIAKSVLGKFQDQNIWLIGCLFMFSSTLCWSFWLILQVPISAHYPDNLSLAAWMCLFGTIQCVVVTFFLEKDPNAWILHSYSEFAICLFAGIGALALSFTVQAWAISKRGPVFSALFNPLCTVIVTLAALFFQEEIYTGRNLCSVLRWDTTWLNKKIKKKRYTEALEERVISLITLFAGILRASRKDRLLGKFVENEFE